MVNTFLIGVQKAGTTSLYDWIAQHPQVEGSWPLKDIPVFVDPEFKFNEEWLNKQYSKNKKINIHGSIEYFFYSETFLKNIKKYTENGAKFIIILRNPVSRAFSWYSYAVKSNMISYSETDRFNLIREKEIINKVNSSYYNTSRLTPIHYSFYSKNLRTLLKNIPPNQIKICIYEEFFANKERSIKDIYQFLEIDSEFVPRFKKINVSGIPRIKNISLLWDNFLIQKVLKPIIPYKSRQKMVKYITEKNTKPVKFEFNVQETNYLKDIFKKDIAETEKILNRKIVEWHD